MQRNYGVKDYQPMLDLAECKYEVTSGYKLCPTKKKEKKKKTKLVLVVGILKK